MLNLFILNKQHLGRKIKLMMPIWVKRGLLAVYHPVGVLMENAYRAGKRPPKRPDLRVKREGVPGICYGNDYSRKFRELIRE